MPCMKACACDPKAQIDSICAAFSRILGEDLVGIYVHGSLAFGCFNWEKSDIDFLAVVETEPTLLQKRQIIDSLLRLPGPKKGYEMSMVLRADALAAKHPIPYVLHFSESHRQRYEADLDAHLMRLRGVDPDLAAHFAVMHAAGFAACGEPIETVFGKISRADYLDSIRGDVLDILENPLANPLYSVLNLQRAAAYVRDGLILSKLSGCDWAKENFPAFSPAIEAVRVCYMTDAPYQPDEAWLQVLCEALKELLLGTPSPNPCQRD